MTRAQMEIDSSGEATTPASRALRLAWRFHKRVMLYIKAFASIGLTLAGTIAANYNVADLQGYARTIFADNVKLPVILGGITVFYLVATLVLKLPKGFSANIKLDEGE